MEDAPKSLTSPNGVSRPAWRLGVLSTQPNRRIGPHLVGRQRHPTKQDSSRQGFPTWLRA